MGIDRSGVGEGEIGDRQDEEWLGEGESGDKSGVGGESGDRQEWKGRLKWG